MQKIRHITQNLIDRFFTGLDMPSFKIVDQAKAKWLGGTQLRKSGKITIYLQKRILSDEKTLTRVLAHELIHCWQFVTNEYYTNISFLSPVKKREVLKIDIHKLSDFIEKMNEINEFYGEPFVTATANDSYVIDNTKEFYVFLAKKHDGTICYTTYFKYTAQIFERTKNWSKHFADTKLIKSRDLDLLTSNSRYLYKTTRDLNFLFDKTNIQ